MFRIGKTIRLFLCLIFLAVITTTIVHIFSHPWYTSLIPTRCLDEHKVYIHGRLLCDKSQGVRYLSYQPPGGGWNNQRIVFENALVLAKLLNRTLIVQPLAPHEELRRVHKVRDYEKYNMVSNEKLLPLSKVIDLELLSKLIPVKEFTSVHVEFQTSYSHFRWAKVCHNGLVGTWVDVKPNKTDEHKWRLLRQLMKSLPAYKDIPNYRRICKTEVEKFEIDGYRPVWGIRDELSRRNEEMLYFSEGSLQNQGLMFFDKKTVADIHDWLMRFVRFAPHIEKRVRTVLDTIKQPFNAIHVRRTDRTLSSGVKQPQHWLQRLQKLKALNLTKTLYIATDERNKTWFKPFRQAGYNVLFAEDFADQLQPKDMDGIFIQDVSGLCEQLICVHANNFVGSRYSSFTTFIERMRKQFSWEKGMLLRGRYASIKWISNSTMQT